MKFELTEKQLSNLLIFMERVDLKGNEAPAFMEMLEILKNQYDEQLKEESKKGD